MKDLLTCVLTVCLSAGCLEAWSSYPGQRLHALVDGFISAALFMAFLFSALCVAAVLVQLGGAQ